MGTPNKGQLIFRENESNKGNLGIPLFAIFTKLCQIRDFFKFQLVKRHFLIIEASDQWRITYLAKILAYFDCFLAE